MPIAKHLRPIATKASIAALYHMAETHGEITIRVADKRACLVIRNKCYKHRASLRKSAEAHTGIHASSLDSFRFSYKPETIPDNHPTGKWLFTISYDEIVEFELMLPPESPIWKDNETLDYADSPIDTAFSDICNDLDCPRCGGDPESSHTGSSLI